MQGPVQRNPEQDAFERAFQCAFDFTCYHLGRAVTLVGTLGRLKCDPVYLSVARRRMRECGFSHRRAGLLYLTREGTHYIGFIAGLVLVCGAAVYGYVQFAPERAVLYVDPMPTPSVVFPEVRPVVPTNYPAVSTNHPSVSTRHPGISTNHAK